ncbi:hypothetical protein M569_14602, partial [Genlisea aurea]
MPAEESSSSSVWTREQDKQFERAIVTYSDDCPDRWEKVASEVAGKSAGEVRDHYEVLLDDVSRIESGFVELPSYNSSSDGSTSHAAEDGKKSNSGESNQGSGKSSRSDQERRKGIAWTEDEHRLFLLGLDKYGKGDWRSISRNFVVTRTPTQVASHAQKYFIRLNSMNKDRRRSSIHDITSVNVNAAGAGGGGGGGGGGDVPITGTAAAASPGAKSNSGKHPPPPGIYGQPTIGQPVGGPLVSAVGTPVNLPPPGHMAAYGIPGGVVPGAPLTMPPATYHTP